MRVVRRVVSATMLSLSLVLAASPATIAAPTYCASIAKYVYWSSKSFNYATATPYYLMSVSQRSTYRKLIAKRDNWRLAAIRDLRTAGSSLAEHFATATRAGDSVSFADWMSAVNRSEATFKQICGFSPYESD